MAFGLCFYAKGRRLLPHMTAPNPLSTKEIRIVASVVIAVVLALFMAIHLDALRLDNFSNILLCIVILAAIGYFSRLLVDHRVDTAHRSYLLAYIPLFIAACIFWALWYQIYTVVTVYFDETMQATRQIGSFVIPVSWKDSLQSLWVILFSGVMAALWTKLGKRQPKTPLKFALSLMVLSLCYFIFVPFLSIGYSMPLIIFALAIWFNTLSELLISPIALSFVTRIAPVHVKTQMVALNFLSLSLGFTLGGRYFAIFYQEKNPLSFYMMTGIISFVAGIVILLLIPTLNRLLKGAE